MSDSFRPIIIVTARCARCGTQQRIEGDAATRQEATRRFREEHDPARGCDPHISFVPPTS